jgi:putative ABC transport system substrate-binding protein
VRRVGWLLLANVYDSSTQVVALRDGLQKLGWIEDRNLKLEVRYAGSDPKAVAAYADELVRLAPDVIVTTGGAPTRALQQRTQTIPIVITGAGDPVDAGYVKSLARPGGNITGITNLYPSIGGKWLELIKDAAPRVTRAAILLSQNSRGGYVASIEAAATALTVEAIRTPYGNAAELERAIEAVAAQANGSLIVHPPGPTGADGDLLFKMAIKHRLPAIYQERSYVLQGGLMSYGSRSNDNVRQAASYVDRILRGANPSDLPVQFPTKFEFVINLRTAKAMGLDISLNMISIADEVIE